MNDSTRTTGSTRAPGVPVELWNDKNRELNDLINDLSDLSCVVEASGEVKCEPSGSARITGSVVLDSRDAWGDFTLLILDRRDLTIAGISSNDNLVPSTHDSAEMERVTHVTVTFVERGR